LDDRIGTTCSISIVLPEPTGPPIPILGIRLELMEKVRPKSSNKHF
jgi:hypothetical protein